MQPNYLTINVIASMIINEIEKKVINILPTSSIEFDEIDYSILVFITIEQPKLIRNIRV